MADFEYPGVRIIVEASLDRLRQPFKIDVSTDDVITPSAVIHEYPLMFENRTIAILSYNIETLLAEKIQTVLNRGIANTRIRDFYDIHMITEDTNIHIDLPILKKAFQATCQKRNTLFDQETLCTRFSELAEDQEMPARWAQFKESNYFVDDVLWEKVLSSLERIIETLF